MNPRPQDLLEHALAVSEADDAVVIVTASTGANLRWANNTLTTNGVMSSASVTVISFDSRHDGVATASISAAATTTEQVDEIVRRADRAARTATVAEDTADLVAARTSNDFGEAPEQTDIGVFAPFARDLGHAFEEASGRDRILYGFVSHDVSTTYVGSSRGLRLRHVQPTGHYACTGKDSSLTRSAWTGGATRDFSDVSAAEMAATVAQRLGWAERRIELPAGRYDTILPPSSVADLMIDAYWGAGARVAHEGESVYSRRGGGTRIGDKVAAPGVSLFSDPTYPGLECAPFVMAGASDNTESVFDNGLPLERTDWIRDGLLTGLLQTRHTASMTGQPVTPMIDNLVLEIGDGAGTVEDMVAGTQRGLLLTCLWYIREVDPQTMLLTGLTRDGVYVVEDGEIVGAANNFRWNESPVDLLNRFSAASETVPSFSREWGDDYFSRTATPALRIPDFNMSSVSQGV